MAKKAIQPPQDLITSEIAERLGISPRAVCGLIERGRFPNARKIPGGRGTHLVPYSDYESYLVYREKRNKKRRQPVEETD